MELIRAENKLQQKYLNIGEVYGNAG